MRQAIWRMAGAALLVLSCGVRLSGQTPVVDPYKLPMVQAACGTKFGTPPQAMSGGHVENTRLRAGMARVYVITETRGIFGSKGAPVRLGLDGKWFGANRSFVYGYSFVDVTPGVHHLCVASTVKGLLPHTSEGIVLARVEAAADQTYFFYNQCIRIAHILTLSPISTDDGAMYLQALPSSKLPKLWKTAAAQAACGIHPDKMPSGSPPPPNLPGPTDEGRALVYFFSGVPQFSGHSSLARSFGAIPPIHVGADGHWIGETEVRSYLGVQMAPGKHSLCSATRILLGVKPTLHIGQIDVVAGKTYFVDTNTLQPVEQGLATVWLRRIAAMPKSDSPNRKALNKWSKTNFPASPDELRTCGIPDLNSTAPAPPPVSWGNGAAPASQIFFLLKSDIKRLHRGHAVDVGFDGRWAVELQTTSWTSFPVAAGEHNVCIHIGNGLKRRDHWFSSDETLFLDSVNAVNGMSLYFISHLIVLGNSDGATIFIFRSSRLDPDEAALLVAYYPHAGTHLSHSRKVTRTSVTPLPLSSAPGAFPTAASSIRLRSVPFIA